MQLRENKYLNFILIIVVLAGLFFSILILKQIKKLSHHYEVNPMYSKIIEYNIPMFKLNNFNNDEYDFNSNSILTLLGINKDNYLNIVGREISCVNANLLCNEEGYKNGIGMDSDKFVDKFTLDDNQICDKVDKIDKKIKKTNISSKPEVLIYHTHTCEGYKPYGISVKDQDKNICVVGEKLKKELETYGISVVHDTTIHDIETYDKSYDKSRITLKKYLSKYKNFKLIIDLHRDSVENKRAVTTNINGENVARFGFVMTRKSPRFNKSIPKVEKIRALSNKYYPGFNKGTFYYNYGKKYYNQDMNDNAVLIELGSHINTLDEAKASTKYLGRILAEYINGNN